jgi:hypothetical protein
MDAMTQGRARETQGRENGHDHSARHRPRGAAARRRWILLQTQGLSSDGRFARRNHWPPYGTYTGCIGFDVVGVDTAETMLPEAEFKSEQLNDAVRRRLSFVRGDLRCWRSATPFDLIVTPMRIAVARDPASQEEANLGALCSCAMYRVVLQRPL